MHTFESLSTSSRSRFAARGHLAVVGQLAALLLVAGCGGGGPDTSEPIDGVDSQQGELRNNGGRTPEQTKCDEKWQSCYVDCSVRYPDGAGGLSPDLREGCYDSCDAAHNLCLIAARSGGTGGLSTGTIQTGAVLDATTTTSSSGATAGGASDLAAAAATRTQLKSCVATADGGLWCCEPIATFPYISCTYTPPPDTIWTFTAKAAVAP